MSYQAGIIRRLEAEGAIENKGWKFRDFSHVVLARAGRLFLNPGESGIVARFESGPRASQYLSGCGVHPVSGDWGCSKGGGEQIFWGALESIKIPAAGREIADMTATIQGRMARLSGAWPDDNPYSGHLAACWAEGWNG